MKSAFGVSWDSNVKCKLWQPTTPATTASAPKTAAVTPAKAASAKTTPATTAWAPKTAVPKTVAASVKTTTATTTSAPKTAGLKTVLATAATVKTTKTAAGKTAATVSSPPAAIVCPPVAPAPALVASRGCTIRQGRVKTVLKEKGYGFIVLDDKELFFHVSIPGGDSVQGNDIVEVEVPKTTDGSGRMRAKQVRLLRRGSIFRQMCKNKCCVANGERHWEDHCPRGGSTTSVALIPATAVAPKTSAAAALTTALVAAPKTAAVPAKMVTTAATSLKSVSTTKAPAVRLQNRYQMFDDDDDDDQKDDGKTDDGSVSTDCS